MKGEEFLELGESLLVSHSRCKCRAAIGRAYYGVLNATAGLMKSCGLEPPIRSAIHQKIWQDLLNCGIDELKLAGSQLAGLHGMRIKADYDMENDDPEDYKTACFWVGEARAHLTTITKFFTGPDRAKVVTAIQQYRKLVGR